MAARKTPRKIVSGGPIIAAIAKENRELWTLVNLGFSAVLDAVEELHRREVEQAAKLERIAEVVAPTDEQRRQTRMSIDDEANSFDVDPEPRAAKVRA